MMQDNNRFGREEVADMKCNRINLRVGMIDSCSGNLMQVKDSNHS